MQLQLSNISYTYPGASSPALTQTTVTFKQGWTGIVGDNGCGKSTLAKLACGELLPDKGNISPHLFHAFCQQDASVAPHNLFDFASDWSSHAQKIRHLLHINDEWFWRYVTLSGGQQKRLQIACALWVEPDVLVMDEPTNELDAQTRLIVQTALQSFDGIGLLISHDKALLDTLCTQCVLFEAGQFVSRPGNYSQASAQAHLDQTTLVHQREKARATAKRLEAEAQRRRAEAAKSDSKRDGRKLNRKDSDAREKRGRAIVSGKDGVAGKLSATMNARLEKSQAALDNLVVATRYESRFKAYGSPAATPTAAHMDPRTLYAGDFALAIPEIWIDRHDHIVLQGNNGEGKSMFVRELLKCISDAIQVAYLPQTVDETMRKHALDQLGNLSSKAQGEILSIVGNLNSDPHRILDGEELSPGETKKLLLALQLVQNPQLMILDEPTNHLDMGSIEALTELLSTFPGAFVVVSHDQALVKALVDTSDVTHWCIADGQLVTKGHF